MLERLKSVLAKEEKGVLKLHKNRIHMLGGKLIRGKKVSPGMVLKAIIGWPT